MVIIWMTPMTVISRLGWGRAIRPVAIPRETEVSAATVPSHTESIMGIRDRLIERPSPEQFAHMSVATLREAGREGPYTVLRDRFGICVGKGGNTTLINPHQPRPDISGLPGRGRRGPCGDHRAPCRRVCCARCTRPPPRRPPLIAAPESATAVVASLSAPDQPTRRTRVSGPHLYFATTAPASIAPPAPAR